MLWNKLTALFKEYDFIVAAAQKLSAVTIVFFLLILPFMIMFDPTRAISIGLFLIALILAEIAI
jgi:hypothetical protein